MFGTNAGNNDKNNDNNMAKNIKDDHKTTMAKKSIKDDHKTTKQQQHRQLKHQGRQQNQHGVPHNDSSRSNINDNTLTHVERMSGGRIPVPAAVDCDPLRLGCSLLPKALQQLVPPAPCNTTPRRRG